MVSLSLEYGNCDASCFGYVWMAFLAGPRFDNYRDGFRFGQLGLDLVEQRGLTRYQARTYLCVGALVIPWTIHPASGRELVRRAFDAAYRVGDLAFVGYGFHVSITMSLAVGDSSRGSTGGSRKRLLPFPARPNWVLLVRPAARSSG